ncbi:hypothetical protein C8A05DRAFT_45339 [Staphylotrichum tortipilum]|uniref:EF-hand domain-containing protein n=1 Tax=Staphylotrichum tortipilum TaxID=2831512 RepID=A0AAN6MHY8_9PEZI|nr:hypothetical protein C8A05DRAFT_45339 [Staphylotrichum longicolle]
MSMSSAYKPSPLGLCTPRSSPFRRPQSPGSPNTLRQTTPSASPTKQGPADGAARFMGSPAATSTTSPRQEFRTPRGAHAATVEDVPEPLFGQQQLRPTPRPAPAASAASTATGLTAITSSAGVGHATALSQLQPAQARTMREAFQILDRDSDGVVNREDVADMLNQLGLPSHPSSLNPFFPPSSPQSMTMPLFLSSLAASLASLSSSSELLSAFSAFDDDDSGQVDVAELRDALLHTAPEPGLPHLTAGDVEKVLAGFTGRRAFSKASAVAAGAGKRGEVFRYQEFVGTVTGAGVPGTRVEGEEEA